MIVLLVCCEMQIEFFCVTADFAFKYILHKPQVHNDVEDGNIVSICVLYK